MRTSFTYQLQNNGAYLVSGIQKAGYNSGTGQGQYSFAYNSNNQVKAVVDEVGTVRLSCGTALETERR